MFVAALNSLRITAALGLVLILCVLLAGCETTSNHDNNRYTEFALTEIVVDFSQTQRPILVADLDGEIAKQVTTTRAGAVGMRLGLTNQTARAAAYEEAIRQNVKPHVRDALAPLMRGSRPVRAVIEVRSVFIRSKFGLQQLTGAEVYINGQKRPDNAQFVAGFQLIDVQTGFPIKDLRPVTTTHDGSSTIWEQGPKAPTYGNSARLNKLIFEYMQEVKRRLTDARYGVDAASDDYEEPLFKL